MDDHQLTSHCGSALLNRLANIFVQPQSGVFDEIIFSHSHGKAKTLKQSDYHLYKEFMNPLLKQPLVRAAVKFPRAKDIQRATRMVGQRRELTLRQPRPRPQGRRLPQQERRRVFYPGSEDKIPSA